MNNYVTNMHANERITGSTTSLTVICKGGHDTDFGTTKRVRSTPRSIVDVGARRCVVPPDVRCNARYNLKLYF